MGRTSAAAALLLVASHGCSSSPVLPQPIPSTSPTPLPRVSPNATILQNLEAVREFERASRSNSILVFLGGSTDGQGIVSPTGVWRYQFAAPPLNTLQEWTVSRNGALQFLGERTDALHLAIVELEPLVRLDSPALLEEAAKHGAREFLDAHPDTTIGLFGSYVGGHAVWELGFESRSPRCGFNLVIDATTAELLFRGPPCS